MASPLTNNNAGTGSATTRRSRRPGQEQDAPIMASRGRVVVSSALVIALCLLLQVAWVQVVVAGAEPLVPAMFVFGDSTLDVGNNNYLKNCRAPCKADYPRYGVDYPDHTPTGRFSNGHNLADQLARLLGFDESPPPLLSLPDENRVPQMMRAGINFASGGSGILDGTGQALCGEVLTLSQQVGNFSSLVKSGNKTVADLVSKSLFFFSVGSNDIFEYAHHPKRNATGSLQRLVSSYSDILKGLYDAGARKFSVVSPSLVGCCPTQRLIANRTKEIDRFRCLAPANNLSSALYPMINSMLQDLSAQLPGMNYSLADSIGMVESLLNSTQTPGKNCFTVLDTACCGTGDFGAGSCNISAPLCPNRSSYLFWDGFHPTETATNLTALELFSDPGLFVHPVNVEQLVAPRHP